MRISGRSRKASQGAIFEYYSEDPLLSGRMGSAPVCGVQSRSNCAATIKHFACNNQETNRYTSNSVLSLRALREIYLKPFEICVREATPRTVMMAYNLINGEHASSSRELLTDVLRNEWGFDGFVIMVVLTYELYADTNLINIRYNCVEVFQKEGNEWRVIHSTWSFIRPMDMDFGYVKNVV